MASKSRGASPEDGPRGLKQNRKRLARVMADIAKARAKRDKAQARVVALEALAEELADRLAAEAVSAAAAAGHEADTPATPAG